MKKLVSFVFGFAPLFVVVCMSSSFVSCEKHTTNPDYFVSNGQLCVGNYSKSNFRVEQNLSSEYVHDYPVGNVYVVFEQVDEDASDPYIYSYGTIDVNRKDNGYTVWQIGKIFYKANGNNRTYLGSIDPSEKSNRRSPRVTALLINQAIANHGCAIVQELIRSPYNQWVVY